MDALSFLRHEHRTVEELFKRFESAGEKALKSKRKLVDQIIVALSQHAAIEEEFFYPTMREALKDEDKDMILESLEEHHIVKWTLSELENLPAESERFDAKVTVLIENVRHHVKEEEHELFPKVRAALTAGALKTLGMQLEMAKKSAPKRPHPRMPDTPPGNLVVRPMEAALDKGRDLVKSLAARAKASRQPREPKEPPSRTLH